MMTRTSLISVAVGMALVGAACGGVSTDPGDGTRTLEVRADVDLRGSYADFEVRVRRDGSDVTSARVLIASDLGDTELRYGGDGDYEGRQTGHARWYEIEVEAGDDWLNGTVVAPEPARILDPNPNEPWRPREADDGVVWVTWSGELADRVRVETYEFEWEGEDTGELGIPATAFEDIEDEIEIRRRNETPLIGGVSSSRLRVTVETETSIAIIDPY
jgi:hypothetical protein